MFSRVTTQRSVCGFLALTFLANTLGCTGGNSSDSGPRRNYRIISHVKETPRSLAGYRERSGRYTIAFEDRKAHDVSYYLRNYVTRGQGDLVLGVTDATGDSHYWISDEASTVTIESAGGVEQLLINPDESVTLDGMWFQTGHEAAAYLDATPTLGAVSDYSVAVAHDQAATEMASYEDGSRSTAVVYIVTATWLITSALLCRREYRRVNYNYSSMSQYCQGWCRAAPCR